MQSSEIVLKRHYSVVKHCLKYMLPRVRAMHSKGNRGIVRWDPTKVHVSEGKPKGEEPELVLLENLDPHTVPARAAMDYDIKKNIVVAITLPDDRGKRRQFVVICTVTQGENACLDSALCAAP